MSNNDHTQCATCPVHHAGNLVQLGIRMGDYDYLVALAGNPNTGKSTLFNNLTGLKQHTGNWPGKTVTRAEGGFVFHENKFKLVDLPGTYSLLSTSEDEEIARDFILFGKPDVTVIVVDATRLQRNLNLVLQILEITDRAVLCLNLMDEAARNGVTIDQRHLSRLLGIPVVPVTAINKQGIPELLGQIDDVANARFICQPRRKNLYPKTLEQPITELYRLLEVPFKGVPNLKWVAMRLLEGDPTLTQAVLDGSLVHLIQDNTQELTGTNTQQREAIISEAQSLRWRLGKNIHDQIITSIFEDAAQIAGEVITKKDEGQLFSLDRKIDRIVTSKWLGFPIMFLILSIVFWLTISGANVPSKMLSSLLVDTFHPALKSMANNLSFPWWLSGLLIDGAYLSMAWVISVMLPPMAIFFPLFTLLEDFGYLPRVSFNMDHIFKKVGAHGKQAITMSMGFGCNAAAVVSTKIIDSPRERLIAIITNNFSLCNGRWPTQILLASIFIGVLVPARWAGLISSAAVVGIALLGIFFSLLVSWVLSHTVLKGEASAFSLELPPYRPPRIWQTLYTSLIDRTMIVLWRAVVFAVPAGLVIWLVANVTIHDTSIAELFITWSDPVTLIFGLNGVILLAYIIAIPANEIVIPTILMLTVLSTGIGGEQAGVIFESDSIHDIAGILHSGGWTVLTAINVMLFSLLHNPCSTTIYTIYKETRSTKWTLIASLLPLALGLITTFFVTQIWRLFVL